MWLQGNFAARFSSTLKILESGPEDVHPERWNLILLGRMYFFVFFVILSFLGEEDTRIELGWRMRDEW